MLVPDPVYPVYVDTNVMAGRKIVYAAATEENGFLPMPDENTNADIIYICSPNNPTGAAYTKGQLGKWVEYALRKNAVILYDAAYECFAEEGVARSIYEVEGAKKCAIELCSFSKTAGFHLPHRSVIPTPRRLSKRHPAFHPLDRSRGSALRHLPVPSSLLL